ncbi:MAG: class I SAM-dependent methyltransferase, partial [Candidatus Neomarinimicrobiota bacterium]
MHSEPYSRARIQKILRCPDCKSTALEFHDKGMTCTGCHQEFATWKNGYVLIGKESPVRQWYPVSGDRPVPRNNPPFLKRVYKWLRPPDRVWTNQSIAVLKQVLNSRLKDLQEGKGMITGAGFERMYRKVLKGYPPLLRYGLTTKGRIDIHGDLCDIPLQDRSLRVIISSSVLEHVYNPERAVAELYRVLEPGGEVYVEIPFIRGFHLIPVDYQRYTIAGIGELFRRHGFQIIDKGISSG